MLRPPLGFCIGWTCGAVLSADSSHWAKGHLLPAFGVLAVLLMIRAIYLGVIYLSVRLGHKWGKNGRATRLLYEHLTPKQWRTYALFHYIDIPTERYRYRVHKARFVPCVSRVSEHTVTRMCAHPKGDLLPLADEVLAIKCWIERDYKKFNQVANVWTTRARF